MSVKSVQIKLDGLIKSFKGMNRVQVVALKRLEGEIKRRIFNDGRATNGILIGHYRSRLWRQERIRRGRQVQYKDLEFEGDMRRSMTVGKTNTRNNAFGFTRDSERLKAVENEQRERKQIFRPNKAEIKAFHKAFVREIRLLYRKNIK